MYEAFHESRRDRVPVLVLGPFRGSYGNPATAVRLVPGGSLAQPVYGRLHTCGRLTAVRVFKQGRQGAHGSVRDVPTGRPRFASHMEMNGSSASFHSWPVAEVTQVWGVGLSFQFRSSKVY